MRRAPWWSATTFALTPRARRSQSHYQPRCLKCCGHSYQVDAQVVILRGIEHCFCRRRTLEGNTTSTFLTTNGRTWLATRLQSHGQFNRLEVFRLRFLKQLVQIQPSHGKQVFSRPRTVAMRLTAISVRCPAADRIALSPRNSAARPNCNRPGPCGE